MFLNVTNIMLVLGAVLTTIFRFTTFRSYDPGFESAKDAKWVQLWTQVNRWLASICCGATATFTIFFCVMVLGTGAGSIPMNHYLIVDRSTQQIVKIQEERRLLFPFNPAFRRYAAVNYDYQHHYVGVRVANGKEAILLQLHLATGGTVDDALAYWRIVGDIPRDKLERWLKPSITALVTQQLGWLEENHDQFNAVTQRRLRLTSQAFLEPTLASAGMQLLTIRIVDEREFSADHAITL